VILPPLVFLGFVDDKEMIENKENKFLKHLPYIKRWKHQKAEKNK
jgi:hypothetical protein